MNNFEIMRHRESKISPELIREFLDYDGKSGEFRWRKRGSQYFAQTAVRSKEHICKIWNNRFAGKIAGHIDHNGYMILSLFKSSMKCHRLAWLHVTGNWPDGFIDHVNGNRADNRLSNLRVVSMSQNSANARSKSTNSSGRKGVTWHKGKWCAQICVQRKPRYIGYFNTVEEAAAAYEMAAIKYFGEFARGDNGRIEK